MHGNSLVHLFIKYTVLAIAKGFDMNAGNRVGSVVKGPLRALVDVNSAHKGVTANPCEQKEKIDSLIQCLKILQNPILV